MKGGARSEHLLHGAGGENRTRVASLEGWSFTTKLHPRVRCSGRRAHRDGKRYYSVRGRGVKCGARPGHGGSSAATWTRLDNGGDFSHISPVV